MRVRLTVTKYQKNMVHYNSKVICISEGEAYLLTLKSKNENGKTLPISYEVWETVTKVVDDYIDQVREHKKIYKIDRADHFTVTFINGEKGLGLLIQKQVQDIDAMMIAKGLNKLIAQSLVNVA